MDFKTVQTGKSGGFNEIFKNINDNFVEAENKFLTEVTHDDLPIGGANIGGVKNGGNVTINADGTMSAPESPEGGLIVTKIFFTLGDTRWSSLSDGIYSLTIPNAGADIFGVFMEEPTGIFRIPVVDVEYTTTNTIIKSMNKFAGYILQGVI